MGGGGSGGRGGRGEEEGEGLMSITGLVFKEQASVRIRG